MPCGSEYTNLPAFSAPAYRYVVNDWCSRARLLPIRASRNCGSAMSSGTRSNFARTMGSPSEVTYRPGTGPWRRSRRGRLRRATWDRVNGPLERVVAGFPHAATGFIYSSVHSLIGHHRRYSGTSEDPRGG